jgi:hypothetical protein
MARLGRLVFVVVVDVFHDVPFLLANGSSFKFLENIFSKI